MGASVPHVSISDAKCASLQFVRPLKGGANGYTSHNVNQLKQYMHQLVSSNDTLNNRK